MGTSVLARHVLDQGYFQFVMVSGGGFPPIPMQYA
jgi:hypothetical protein